MDVELLGTEGKGDPKASRWVERMSKRRLDEKWEG